MPLPQLLPYLDEGLHLLGAREPVVNHTALLVAALVQILERMRAQVREVVAEVFQVLLAQNVSLLAIRTPGHGGGYYHVRFSFAHKI